MIKRGLIINSRFELVEPIGQGAFGCVWDAIDLVSEENVALKLV